MNPFLYSNLGLLIIDNIKGTQNKIFTLLHICVKNGM